MKPEHLASYLLLVYLLLKKKKLKVNIISARVSITQAKTSSYTDEGKGCLTAFEIQPCVCIRANLLGVTRQCYLFICLFFICDQS